MNTQEILNKIEQLPSHLIDKKVVISKDSVVELVRQLDERPKVKIPQFVAEWIEECKSIPLSLNLAFNSQCIPDDVASWLIKFENQETFARAWLDGYEVEQEIKYRVRIKDGLVIGDTLTENPITHLLTFSIGNDSDNEIFTKKELEEWGFGDVFNNSMFEVVEVE